MTRAVPIPSGRDLHLQPDRLPASGILLDGQTGSPMPVRLTARTSPTGLTFTLTTDPRDGAVSVSADRTAADGGWTLTAYDRGTQSPVTLTEPFVRVLNALLADDGFSLRVDWRTKAHGIVGVPNRRLPLLDSVAVSTGPSKVRDSQRPATLSGAPAAAAAAPTPAPAPVVAPAPAAPATTPAAATSNPRLSTVTPPKHSGTVVLPDEVRTRWTMARNATRNGHPVVIALAGPTGTAKTHTARYLAREDGTPCTVFSCSGVRDPQEWFGFVGAEGGSTYHTDSDLLLALTEPGERVLVLDELNRASGFALNALLPVLEGAGWVTHPLTGNRIDLNPQVQIVLTLNEGYVHTEPLDEAVWNRIGCWLRLDYLTQEQDEALLRERFPKMARRDAANLALLGAVTRAKARAGECDAVSTRQLHEAAAQMADTPDAPRRFAVDSAVLDAFGPDSRGRDVVAVLVNGIVWDEPQKA